MPNNTHRRALLTVALGAMVLSGCWFMPGDGWVTYGPQGPTGTPGPTIEYTTGSATLTLEGGEAVNVDLPLQSGGREPTGIEWLSYRAGDTWAVQLQDYGAMMEGFGSAPQWQVMLHRLLDGHWVATEYADPCRVDITRADDGSLTGTATCQGLRWSDAVDTYSFMGSGGDPFIPGQSGFDARIEFHASVATPARSAASVPPPSGEPSALPSDEP